jgi:hypothetical protein
LNTASLLWGVLFGAVGLGFFVYGKKQKAIVPLACGVALMVAPYLVSNAWLLAGVGLGLVVIPYFFRV